MHGLEVIKAWNKIAAKQQTTERPETLTRKANIPANRWPTTEEKYASRKPAPHGDPLANGNRIPKYDPEPVDTNKYEETWREDEAIDAQLETDEYQAGYDDGFISGFLTACDHFHKRGW